MWLIFLLWGLVAGYFAGFLGIGAGVLIMPFLVLMGIPYQSAVDASLMAVCTSSITTTIQHHRNGGLSFEPILVVAIPGAISALIGSLYLIHVIPVKILEIIFAGLMFLNVDLLKIANKMTAINKSSSTDSIKYKQYFPQLIFIGIISGLMASLLGIGGGILIVTLLVVLTNFTLKDAVKCSAAIMVEATFFSLCADIIQNTLPYAVGVPSAIGAVVGSFLGSIALSYVENDIIRKLNYIISFGLGFLMIFQVLFTA